MYKKILINSALGVILILIWLHFVDIKQIIATISQIEIIKLLPAFFFMLLAGIFRALRLKIFLSPIKKVALKDLIFLYGFGMLLNYFIPIRGGEIAKGIYLNSAYDLPVSKSLVWIFLDRFIDFLVVIILAATLLLIIPTSVSITIIKIITIILTSLLILIYFIVYKVNFARKMLKFLTYLLIVKSIKIYFVRISNFFLDSFSIFKRNPSELALLFLISALAYGAEAMIWFFIFLSLGSYQSLLKMYLAQLLSALTYLIPAAPGYVGSAEASGLLVFSGILGIDKDLSSAMIVLFHMATAIFILVYGLISVYLLKIDLGLILRRIFKRET